MRIDGLSKNCFNDIISATGEEEGRWAKYVARAIVINL